MVVQNPWDRFFFLQPGYTSSFHPPGSSSMSTTPLSSSSMSKKSVQRSSVEIPIDCRKLLSLRRWLWADFSARVGNRVLVDGHHSYRGDASKNRRALEAKCFPPLHCRKHTTTISLNTSKLDPPTGLGRSTVPLGAHYLGYMN